MTPTSPLTRDQLILANLRLVRGIARDFIRSRLDIEDVIQEGMLGLVRAADCYSDGDGGVPFAVWARYWIRQAIMSAVAKQVWSCPDRGCGLDLDRLPAREEREQNDELWDAIDALAPCDRPAVVLFFGLDGSAPAGRRRVAKKLGTTAAQARRSRERSLEKLRTHLSA